MKLFKPLYEFALRWAAHPQAEYFLAGLSFIEAFIFPVAPEVMIAPMTLAKPRRWARYATISLCGSIAGAFVGYALGHYAFHLIQPLFERLGWMPTLNEFVAKLRELKTDSNPLLLKVNMGAGHGGSSGRYDALRETAADQAFMLTQMGISQ